MDLGVNRAFELLADKLQNWVNTAIQLIPNIIAALLILLVFFIIGWLIRRAVSKTLHRTTSNQAVIHLLETIVGITVVAVGIFIALGVLKLDGIVTSLLATAGVIGLALGFAFQNIAANFMSGIIISVRHPFGIGDIIESNDYYGYVHEINLRCTIIRTTQGQLVYIPNQELLNQPFVNYTWNKKRRIDLECGVSYGDDLEKVQKVAIEAIEEGVPDVLKDHEVQVEFKEFGGSSINFDIRFWIEFDQNYDFIGHRSDAVIAIKKKFDENGVTMPFPTRTLDFGIRGTEKLEGTGRENISIISKELRG